MERQVQRVGGVFALFLLVALLLPATAWADEDPLRLAYLNTAGGAGELSYTAVATILEESPQIDLMDPDRFLAAAAGAGLTLDSFRQGSERERLIDEFAALLRANDLEGLLIHDAFGTTAQIVVIGPMGWEIADVRRSTRGGRLSQDDAVGALQQVFEPLVPEVRGYRRELEEAARAEAEARARAEQEAAAAPEPEPEPEPRDGLPRTIDVRLGLLTGQRAMFLDQPEGIFSITHIASLMGIYVGADAHLLPLGDDSALTASLRLGWSPLSTETATEVLSGNFLRLGADVGALRRLNPALDLRGSLGLEFLNITLDPNPQYTGHGYLLGRLGLGLAYRFGELLTFSLDGLGLLTLSSSNSGGAYGEASGGLGYGVATGIHLEILAPLLFSATYGMDRVSLEYPEPDVLARGARSRETVHQVAITAGYRF